MALSILSRSTLPSAVLLATTVVGSAQLALAEEPDPVEVYERYADHPSGATRLQAVRQLEGAHGPEVVAALAERLEDEDGRVRNAAERLLVAGLTTREELDQLARDVLRSRSAEVRLVGLRTLVTTCPHLPMPARPLLFEFTEDRSIHVRRSLAELAEGLAEGDLGVTLLEALLLDDEAVVRADAVRGLAALAPTRLDPERLGRLAGDSDAAVRVAAHLAWCDALGTGDVESVSRGLDDASWSVRVAAARALGSGWGEPSRFRACVAALIERLVAEPRLRVRHAMGHALFDLTGIDFGSDPEVWADWWREHGQEYEMPEKRPRRPARTHAGTRSRYLDVPVESDHVCFVLDDSHSMLDPIQFGSERLKRDVLHAAVDDCLERLPRDTRVNVIPFGTEPDPYKRRLFRLTPGSHKGILKHLRGHPSDGRTNLFDSLVAALDDTDVDTLVVVTDGAPSEGAETTRTGILQSLERRNRHRLVRIHTVEIGAERTSKRWRGFLEELAAAHDGTYLAR